MASEISDTQNLIEFVRTTLNSFPRWDVVTFFHNDPFASVDVSSIARFTGRESGEVENALPALVEAGILTTRPTNMGMIYGLTRDPAIREQIARFVAACEDREFRARAIRQVVDGQNRP